MKVEGTLQTIFRQDKRLDCCGFAAQDCLSERHGNGFFGNFFLFFGCKSAFGAD